MVSEKQYRKTLSKQFIVFVLYKPLHLSKVLRSILTSSGTHDNLKVFCKCSTSARSLSAVCLPGKRDHLLHSVQVTDEKYRRTERPEI